MKKIIVSIMLIAVSMMAMQKMQNYRAVPMKKATLVKSGKEKMFCSVCGMTLPMFYRTNHAADHDGIHDQYCSIVCAIEDMVVNGKKLTNFKVVDNTTLKFIPSKDAYFVVGSKKPGTMSMVSKYAFGTLEAAKKFQQENGGKIMRFDELVELVKKSQAKDMAATKKRQAKMIKKGKKMYKKMCQEIDRKFSSTAEAKAYLTKSKACGNIRGRKLQAIGMYLVDRNQ
jgi:hypothetical protein